MAAYLEVTGREVTVVRDLVEGFGKLQVSHSEIEREGETARGVADDLKSTILASLGRLKGILVA